MSTSSPDSGISQSYLCRDCGSEVGFRSRRRNFMERYLLPLFLLQPVRCGDCFRRDYRLIFTKVRERLSDVRRLAPAKHTATANRNIA
ncbi:MAG TPA: hypothetical protein VGS27_33805 [Candidatus Sulfotelmatobacter sp.]|nr:hypothetical protein [Candidatus Sulfotelmatobacter sp.]